MGQFQIKQGYEYIGRDRWRWWVWVDAAPADLERVQQVTWKLHESFARSVVEVANRTENFRLERTGWGIFELRADIKLSDDETIELRHMLDLAYPETSQQERQKSRSDKPTMFLSYTAEDMRIAVTARNHLREAGWEIADNQDIKPGYPRAVALRGLLQKSDGLLSVVTAGFLSDPMYTDLEEAQKAKLPVFILLKKGAQLDSALSSVQVLEFDPQQLDRSIAEGMSQIKIVPR